MRILPRQLTFLVRGSASVRALMSDVNELNVSLSQALHDLRFECEVRASDLESFQEAATDHLRQLQLALNAIEAKLHRAEAEIRDARSEIEGQSELYKEHLLSIQDRLALRASEE